MLYLVRKIDESIVVNNDIVIKVVKIERNSVKLGITFPPEATVLRQEIHDRIKAENKSASNNELDKNVLELPIVREQSTKSED